MVQVQIQVFGEDLVARELLRFSERVEDVKPAFAVVAEKVAGDINRLFDTEGVSGEHGAWAEIAESTATSKAQAGYDPRILHATLALRDSLIDPASPGAKHVLTGSVLEIGSDVEYGKYHMSGTRYMAQRRPADPTNTEKRGYVKVIQRYIMEGLAAAEMGSVT